MTQGHILSPSAFRTLQRHLAEARQEIRNLKARLPGAKRHYGGHGRSRSTAIAVYNDAQETIPAYAIMRIAGSHDTHRYIVVGKPNSNFMALYIVNGSRPIPYPGTGYGRFLVGDDSFAARYALYNSANTPLGGESWSPVPDSWLLHKNGPGFVILGGADGTKVSVLQYIPQEILIKNTSGSSRAANTGPHEYEVWGGASGSESDSGFRVQCYNKMSVAFGDGKFGFAAVVNGQGYAVRIQA